MFPIIKCNLLLPQDYNLLWNYFSVIRKCIIVNHYTSMLQYTYRWEKVVRYFKLRFNTTEICQLEKKCVLFHRCIMKKDWKKEAASRKQKFSERNKRIPLISEADEHLHDLWHYGWNKDIEKESVGFDLKCFCFTADR